MEDTRPKVFVFVLMPFHEDFNDVYQLGIKAACENAGAYYINNLVFRAYFLVVALEFLPGGLRGKTPMDRDRLCVSLRDPGRDFLGQLFDRRDPSIQTLTHQC